MQPLAELRVVRLCELSQRGANPGALLIVRTIGHPRQPRPLLPILNVVEDDAGRYMHIEVYFPTTVPPTAILDFGNILAIKAPECEVTSHGAVIRVVHPSDILTLIPNHRLVPGAFVDLSELSLKSVRVCKKKAKTALKKGEYTKAIAGFSNALNQSSRAGDELRGSRMLHHRRSVAAMHAGLNDLATADAVASVAGPLDKRTKKTDLKLLRQAAHAAYQNQDFSLARAQLQRLLMFCPKDKQGLVMFRKVQARVSEESNGDFDFDSMKEQPLPLERASFTKLTEIRASSGRGRELFTKVDINRGGLILCEKAFETAYPIKISDADPSNAYIADDEKARLWLDVVRRAYADPPQAQRMLALHGGSSYTSQSKVSIIDGQIVIDVYQVAAILRFNCFSHILPIAQQKSDTASHSTKRYQVATRLFIHASYANHSCVENTYTCFVGDMIVVRAVNDIPAGTELTISYYPAHITRPIRHSHIFEAWGVDCNCDLCTAEMQCNVEWDDIYKPARDIWTDKHSHKRASSARIESLARHSERAYSDSRFRGLPRIVVQYLQSFLLDLWIDLKDNSKIRKHAAALLREHGFWIQPSEHERKIELYGPCGMISEAVVDALYWLSHVSTDGGEVVKADQYLALARTMHLTMNGTAREWEQKLGEWRGT